MLAIAIDVMSGDHEPREYVAGSLRALAGAVIGGLDSIWGAIVGSLFVGVVEAVIGGQFTTSGTAELAVLILVIGTLVTRPRGLLGTADAA